MEMELWFTEKQTPDLGITLKIKESLHTERTPYQDLALLDTVQFGRMLVLDGTVQTTERDEFVYHEMLTHVALFTHPEPKRVLVVGGGDGGAIREILKHPSVEKAELVEIDGAVVETSRKYLPEISCALDDPRARVIIDDGVKYVREAHEKYDVIIVDSTDPVGPAVGLFAVEFYRSVFEALKDDGILVAQTESPFVNQNVLSHAYQAVASVFPITRLYLASIPTYPSGLWSFTMGSKRHDPLAVLSDRELNFETKYYTPEMGKACFALPRFVQDLIKQGR